MYNDQVDVGLDREGHPKSFVWRKALYQVTSFSVVQGRPVFSKLYDEARYRCETKQGIVCELVRTNDQWVLEQVWEYKGKTLFIDE